MYDSADLHGATPVAGVSGRDVPNADVVAD